MTGSWPIACLLDPSIASDNTGDAVITDAAERHLEDCLPFVHKVRLGTHERLSRYGARLQRRVDFNIVCGSNLLHSHMEIIKQWNVGFLSSLFLKPCVLLGVGWRANPKWRTTLYTKRLLRRLLSVEHLHSVRDSYAEAHLRKLGIHNVINTSCPSMWSLTREFCADIPATQGEDVVMTITDYSQSPEVDRRLLHTLLKCYRRVYLWCQGADDYKYLKSIGGPGAVEIIPSGLKSYDALLRDNSLSLDYVGTRLHGGIRALQHKRRTLIVGVDHRAVEKGRDFALPVLDRYLSGDDLEKAIRATRACEISIPTENIRRWKDQFATQLSAVASKKPEFSIPANV